MDNENIKNKINDLAVVEFRKFCRNNNLNSFFPADRPNEQSDPAFIYKQMPLINEAVGLFNKENPRIYGTDAVVDFNFNSCFPGDIDYKVNTAISLMSEKDALADNLKELKKTYRFFVVFGSISLFVLLVWIVDKLALYFDPFDEYHIPAVMSLILMLGVLFFEPVVRKVIAKFTNLKNEAEKIKFEKSLTNLKIRLESIAVESRKKNGSTTESKNGSKIGFKKTDSKEAVALFREKMKQDRGIEISEEKARALLKDLDSYFNNFNFRSEKQPNQENKKLHSDLNEADRSINVAGVKLTKRYFPKLYDWAQTNPDTLAEQLISIAKAWHEGDIASAAVAFESDMEHM